MASRLNLHELFKSISGVNGVYFQPPETIKLVYPCIIYERLRGRSFQANDDLYNYVKSYTLTVIDKNPDSLIPDELEKLRYCTMDRYYEADNLNHWIFTIYY